MSKKDCRVKNFAFISYPENGKHSALLSYLCSHSYSAVVSPLHTPDGEDLKPHYHVLIMLSSPRVLDSLKEEFAEFKGTVPFKVADKGAYARYCSHLDNPEKQQFGGQFNGCSLVGLHGSDYDKLTFKPLGAVSVVEVYAKLAHIINYEPVYDYSSLIDYAVKHDDIALCDYVVKHSYAVKSYIDCSVRNRWIMALKDRFTNDEIKDIFGWDVEELSHGLKNWEV